MKNLTFQNTTLVVVPHNNQTYITAADLARALGYSRSDKITQIYTRNQDEFTPDMTLNLKMKVKDYGNGNSEKDVRIFSLRGAHLIAMFSRTKVAKEFRKWVLDILDRETLQISDKILPVAEPKPDVVLAHLDAERIAKYIVRVRAFAKEVEVFHRKLHEQLDIPRYVRNDLAAKGYDIAHEFNVWLDPFVHQVLPETTQTKRLPYTTF